MSYVEQRRQTFAALFAHLYGSEERKFEAVLSLAARSWLYTGWDESERKKQGPQLCGAFL